jgi:DNA-binding response OmpR family regulator
MISPNIGSQAEHPDGPSLRILIIEDSEHISKLSRMILEHDGHVVYTAADAPAGIALAREQQPQVILCDMCLGGAMDGCAVARKLRQESLCNACLIAVSAHADEEYEKLALDAGFDYKLTKPVDFDELSEIMRRFVTSGSAA